MLAESIPPEPPPEDTRGIRGRALSAALRDVGGLRSAAVAEISDAIREGHGQREHVAAVLGVKVRTWDKILGAEPALRLACVDARAEAGLHDPRNGNAVSVPEGRRFVAAAGTSETGAWWERVSEKIEVRRKMAGLEAFAEGRAGTDDDEAPADGEDGEADARTATRRRSDR